MMMIRPSLASSLEHHCHHHHPSYLYRLYSTIVGVLLLTTTTTSTHAFGITSSTSSTIPTAAAAAAAATTPSMMRTTATDGDDSTGGITFGFIGCGTIATSIITGLVRAHNNHHSADHDNDNAEEVIKVRSICVTKRSEAKSQAVQDLIQISNNKAQNKNNQIHVERTENTQQIVNTADVIFITVLPTQAHAVLQALQFDPQRHIVISLVELAHATNLPQAKVAKLICLPSIARHEGIALVCCGKHDTNGAEENTTPPSPTPTQTFVQTLLQPMGGCVLLDTEHDLEACMVTTCTMGPLYGVMQKQRDWLLANTAQLQPQEATKLVVQQFLGSILDASYKLQENNTQTNPTKNGDHENDVDLFQVLIDEQTPGGLNEQALQNVNILGGLDTVQQQVMDATVKRIRGESDGRL